mgnify:CR=1 FL=1
MSCRYGWNVSALTMHWARPRPRQDAAQALRRACRTETVAARPSGGVLRYTVQSRRNLQNALIIRTRSVISDRPFDHILRPNGRFSHTECASTQRARSRVAAGKAFMRHGPKVAWQSDGNRRSLASREGPADRKGPISAHPKRIAQSLSTASWTPSASSDRDRRNLTHGKFRNGAETPEPPKMNAKNSVKLRTPASDWAVPVCAMHAPQSGSAPSCIERLGAILQMFLNEHC